MPKKSKVRLDPVVRRNTAVLVAVVAFLGGLFLGFNVSFFINAERRTVQLDAPAGPSLAAPLVAPQAANAPGADIESLRAAAEAHPEEAHAWIDLGNACFDANRPKEAIAAYERALELRPDHPDVWADLGVMYRRDHQPQKAVESFDRAIASQPGHRTALFNKGIVQSFDLHDTAGAIATWEQLLAIDPRATAPDGTPVREMLDKLKSGQPL